MLVGMSSDWVQIKAMHLHLLLERCFTVIVIGSMAKLQKAGACAGKSTTTRLTIGGAGGRGDEEGHFHPARLRGRRPPLPYSADPLWTNRNTSLSFLSRLSLVRGCVLRCLAELHHRRDETFKLFSCAIIWRRRDNDALTPHRGDSSWFW